MKSFFTLALLLSVLILHADYDRYFTPKILRIDFYRTGNSGNEIISIGKLTEGREWAGSKLHLIDSTGYGTHLFELYDVASEVLIYSKTSCSLFNEWQTTDEAKVTWRTFEETVLCPYPKAIAKAVFYSRNRKNEWMKKFEYQIDPTSMFISREQVTSYPVVDIHCPASPARALDVVFLPDGYTLSELEKFRSDCMRFAGYLLNASPFNRFRDQINIRAVMAPSQQSGPDIPGENAWKQSVAGSNFYTFGSERYLTTMEMWNVHNLASLAPYDQIVILVNTSKYGGGGIYNYYSVTASDHAASDYVFLHEFGHAFAGLGDEYYTSEVAYSEFYDLSVEPWEPNLTTLVDFSRKWKDMVETGTPVPTPPLEQYQNTLGVFEGGGYAAKGIYRPYIDCTMKSLRYNAFCPVCSRAIEYMLKAYLY